MPDGIDSTANGDMCQLDTCFEQDRDDQRMAVDPVWCVHHLQLKRELLAVDLVYWVSFAIEHARLELLAHLR